MTIHYVTVDRGLACGHECHDHLSHHMLTLDA